MCPVVQFLRPQLRRFGVDAIGQVGLVQDKARVQAELAKGGGYITSSRRYFSIFRNKIYGNSTYFCFELLTWSAA